MPWILRAMLPSGVRAITLPPFGMYVKAGYVDDLRIQTHEGIHWEQYQRMGLFKFYITYIWYSWKYGYYDNPLEVEARARSEGL